MLKPGAVRNPIGGARPPRPAIITRPGVPTQPFRPVAPRILFTPRTQARPPTPGGTTPPRPTGEGPGFPVRPPLAPNVPATSAADSQSPAIPGPNNPPANYQGPPPAGPPNNFPGGHPGILLILQPWVPTTTCHLDPVTTPHRGIIPPPHPPALTSSRTTGALVLMEEEGVTRTPLARAMDHPAPGGTSPLTPPLSILGPALPILGAPTTLCIQAQGLILVVPPILGPAAPS